MYLDTGDNASSLLIVCTAGRSMADVPLNAEYTKASG